MTLSIIIPTHKRTEQSAKLLRSIAEQDFPYEDLQVILISNLKDKALRERSSYWESLFFDFKYKEVGSLGVNKARNMGIRFSSGDILYFLDDDCLLANKNHLMNLVLEHKKNPLVIGIGGGYKALESLYGVEKFYHEHSDQWIESFVSSKETVSQLIGGNASYKRKVFDQGFCFDSSIVFGGSEESFNQSLKEAGYTLLYSNKLWVFHVVKLKFLSFIKKSFGQGLGLFKNRYKSGQTIESLSDIKKDWAFLVGKFSFYSFIYSLFFKLGYFWGAAVTKRKSFRLFYFVFLILKSRLYFLSEYAVNNAVGKLWYVLGWLYGRVFFKIFGGLWYVLGWLYGRVFFKIFGGLWYVLGWLYGRVFFKIFGGLWYVLGWLYGRVFFKIFGGLWYVLGWLYGSLFLGVLGWLWYVLGWLYGRVFFKIFGGLWYVLGWLYGSLFLGVLGWLWYVLGWLYGRVFFKIFGGLWYVLGWLYGHVFLKHFIGMLGKLWYVLGWLYGSLFLGVLGWLWYVLGWLYGRVFFKIFGGLWYVLGWLYGHVFLKHFIGMLGKLWYVLGWLYGSLFLGVLGWLWYVLGKLWYVIGWLYGSVFLFLFHHSPPMKVYYFTKYQYYKRIKPLLSGKK